MSPGYVSDIQNGRWRTAAQAFANQHPEHPGLVVRAAVSVGETYEARMTDEDRAALQAERADLVRKVAKRRDMPGMAANVQAIDARIAEIDALLSEAPADG